MKRSIKVVTVPACRVPVRSMTERGLSEQPLTLGNIRVAKGVLSTSGRQVALQPPGGTEMKLIGCVIAAPTLLSFKGSVIAQSGGTS